MSQSAVCRGWLFKIRCHAAGVVLAVILAGCGGKKSAPTQQSGPTVTEQTAPTKVVDPATVGTISGKVTLEGNAPAPREIALTASPACAKLHSSALIYPEVVTGDHGALADVIVYVKSGLRNYRFAVPTAAARIDQRGCMYEPHVQGIMVGAEAQRHEYGSRFAQHPYAAAREPPLEQIAADRLVTDRNVV